MARTKRSTARPLRVTIDREHDEELQAIEEELPQVRQEKNRERVWRQVIKAGLRALRKRPADVLLGRYPD